MFWLIGFGILGLVIVTAVLLRARKHRGGYLAFARDENRKERYAAIFAARDRYVRELQQVPVEGLIELLVSERVQWVVVDELERRGRHVLPELLRAVEDPRFGAPYSEGQRRNMYVSSPLEAVLGLLAGQLDDSHRGLIEPLLEGGDTDIREAAARAYSWIASDGCLPRVLGLLGSDDKDLRDEVLRGLLGGAPSAATPEFRARAYEAVRGLLFKRTKPMGTSPAEVMLALDRARAEVELLSPRVLSKENPQLVATIKALREADVGIPEGVLLSMIDERRATMTEYPDEYIVAEAVVTLARRPTERGRAVIEEMTSAPADRVREHAMEAVCKLHGLEDPWQAISKVMEGRRLEEAPEVVQNVIHCRYLIDQVNNGGISQYFVNGYGRRWRRTLEALEAVGAKVTHELLREAVEKFGPEGPDLAKYDRVVAAIHRKSDNPWPGIDDRFYEDVDDREVLLLRYMLRHKAVFGVDGA